MYTGNTCSINIFKKIIEFFKKGRGLRQGCILSSALFNIYINELATILETSSRPGVSLPNSEVKSLLRRLPLPAVTHCTWPTAEPGPVRAVLPDLCPGSKPQKDSNNYFPEKIQISGN